MCRARLALDLGMPVLLPILQGPASTEGIFAGFPSPPTKRLNGQSGAPSFIQTTGVGCSTVRTPAPALSVFSYPHPQTHTQTTPSRWVTLRLNLHKATEAGGGGAREPLLEALAIKVRQETKSWESQAAALAGPRHCSPG